MLLEHSAIKIVELAKTLNILTRTTGPIKKKLRNNEDLVAKKAGKSGKCKTIPRLDRKIVETCFSNRSSSCRKISSGLAAQGLWYIKKTFNRRLCEAGLKAYGPRQKPRLTEKMKASCRA